MAADDDIPGEERFLPTDRTESEYKRAVGTMYGTPDMLGHRTTQDQIDTYADYLQKHGQVRTRYRYGVDYGSADTMEGQRQPADSMGGAVRQPNRDLPNIWRVWMHYELTDEAIGALAHDIRQRLVPPAPRAVPQPPPGAKKLNKGK